MDAVIPQDVLDHLSEVHRGLDMEGWWRTEHLAHELGCGIDKARRIVRELLRAGRVQRRVVAVTQEQAVDMGLLAAGRVIVYQWVP